MTVEYIWPGTCPPGVSAKRLKSLWFVRGQTLHVESNEAVDADEIPIIDVAGIYSDKLKDRQAVADKVREAAHRIGFFYVINHGFDVKLTDGVFEQAKRFFKLPMEKKLVVDTTSCPRRT
ncbi:hypothetical protein A1O7_08192 [Cladophialophora yegresii CBS 114405]|uniref:Non-haem dioxygenase N-terminal domain-containing protein n=1 Tax=Cladophialophora yegresii CBS 114405 TaxID=1182544 RepID=W9VSW0_9EURO|nr:uncharacterized protein A1O7_08192 [Cladophialophora yegresii CBS 114405]EXJ55266.1 hypothetical protein A1O7_08192 [Cladophialophora yegresii CBS 114405]